MDHIIPQSRGGHNRISNLAPSCLDCNRLKGAMTAAEFGHPEVHSRALQISRDLKVKYKTPHQQDKTKNLKLYIIQQLELGKRPSQICAKLNMNSTTLQYHLNALKESSSINKTGYGTWEVLKPITNRGKSHIKTTHVAPQQLQTNLNFFQQDSVRGHAFLFTLNVPKGLRNWTNEKREQYLNNHKIDYLRLKISGSGQRIIFRGRKVWLTNKSIVIYDTGSYFAERAVEAKSTAIYKFFSIVKGIERLLHVEFAADQNYKFKVSRQHYALVRNALAKQYTEEGQKLEVRTDKGLWFIIDNSFNLNEAETIHPKTAMTDNVKVQDFFNSLKTQPNGVTIDALLEVSNGIQQNQLIFSENALAHVKVIKQLGLRVEDLNVLLNDLKEVLKK